MTQFGVMNKISSEIMHYIISHSYHIHLRTKYNKSNIPCHSCASTQCINFTSWSCSWFSCSSCFSSPFLLCCSECELWIWIGYELDMNSLLFSLFLLWIYRKFPIFFFVPLLSFSSFIYEILLLFMERFTKVGSGDCFFALFYLQQSCFNQSIHLLLVTMHSFLLH